MESEKDLSEQVYKWAVEYRKARPDEYPFKFSDVSRRWARAAYKFKRPLLDILEADGRFLSIVVKRGARLISLRVPNSKPFRFEDYED